MPDDLDQIARECAVELSLSNGPMRPIIRRALERAVEVCAEVCESGADDYETWMHVTHAPHDARTHLRYVANEIRALARGDGSANEAPDDQVVDGGA